jgi:hypothetical protein
MPDLKLSLPERALLLILMAENGELSNRDIREKYAPGLELTGKSRRKLMDAKLVEARQGERNAYFFALADEGGRWCREEFARPAPPDARSGGHALYAVLRGLDRYLNHTRLGLADIFGSLPRAAEESVLTASVAADDIEQAIRRAYRKLAESSGIWVGLADIRDQLGGLPKREVDGVLRLMTRMPGVQIEEETNQKTLTQRDRDAAVRIGSRDQHVLAIAP